MLRYVAGPVTVAIAVTVTAGGGSSVHSGRAVWFVVRLYGTSMDVNSSVEEEQGLRQ